MTQYELEQRYHRIPEPIRAIALNNPLVRRVCDEFAAGHIVTFEEALCQMVIGLSRKWAEQEKRAFGYMMASNPPIVIQENRL
jgi:hypothetical protein